MAPAGCGGADWQDSEQPVMLLQGLAEPSWQVSEELTRKGQPPPGPAHSRGGQQALLQVEAGGSRWKQARDTELLLRIHKDLLEVFLVQSLSCVFKGNGKTNPYFLPATDTLASPVARAPSSALRGNCTWSGTWAVHSSSTS